MSEAHDVSMGLLVRTLSTLAGAKHLDLSPVSFESLSAALSAALVAHPGLILSHIAECFGALNEAIRLRGLMGFAAFSTLLRFHLFPLYLASKPFAWPVLRLLQSSELILCPKRLEIFVQEVNTEALALNDKAAKFVAKYAAKAGENHSETLVAFSPAVMNRTIMYGKALVPRPFFLSTHAVYAQNPSVNRYIALGGKTGYASRIALTSLSTIEGVPSAFGLGNQAIKIGSLEGSIEPTTFVFPELTLLGSQRRDCWLHNLREIAAAHAFIEQCRLWAVTGTPKEKRRWSELQEIQVLALARENVVRFHAAQSVIHHEFLPKGSPSSPHWQLGFSGTLLRYRDLKVPSSKQVVEIGMWEIVDVPAARALMAWLCQPDLAAEERMHTVMQTLWTQNTISMHNEEKKADATFTDMPRAMALMQTLVEPLRHAAECLPPVLTWEKKELSGAVCVGCVLLVAFDLVQYMPAILVLSQALIMMHLYVLKHRGLKFPVFRPERQKQPLVARVIRARQRMQKVQDLMNTVNHTLLVLRALYTSESPGHTTAAICALIIAGLVLAFVPGRFLFLLLAAHVLTCQLQFRRESMRRVRKRVRTFFNGIPIVALEDPEDGC